MTAVLRTGANLDRCQNARLPFTPLNPSPDNAPPHRAAPLFKESRVFFLPGPARCPRYPHSSKGRLSAVATGFGGLGGGALYECWCPSWPVEPSPGESRPVSQWACMIISPSLAVSKRALRYSISRLPLAACRTQLNHLRSAFPSLLAGAGHLLFRPIFRVTFSLLVVHYRPSQSFPQTERKITKVSPGRPRLSVGSEATDSALIRCEKCCWLQRTQQAAPTTESIKNDRQEQRSIKKGQLGLLQDETG
ncbi:hypothetical protein VTI28DRAFT_8935 [Corynascus sepedonium]